MSSDLRRDRLFLRRIARLSRQSRYRLTTVAFVVCATPPILRALILPPLGWDTLTYHSFKAALWVQQGQTGGMDGPGPWAYYRGMFAGAEVFLAWAMLPMRSDTLTPLVDITQWLALGFATLVLARRLGAREPFASTAAGFVLALPTVRLMVGAAYAELCLLAAFIAGLALGLAAHRRRPALLALAGGALGVAAAAKLPMIAISAGPLVLFLGRAWFRGGPGVRPWAVAAALAYTIALGPWLVMATLATGAPLSPVPVRIGGMVLGESPPELDWYLDRSYTEGARALTETDVVRDLFLPTGRATEALGLFALVPIAAMVFGIPALARRSPVGAWAVLAGASACVAFYYSPDFAIIRHFWSVNSSRFLLPAMALAIVTSVAWCRQRSWRAHLYRRLLMVLALWNLLAYTLVGTSPVSIYGSLITLAGIAALGGTWMSARGLRSHALRLGLQVGIVIIGVAALQQWRSVLRHDLLARDYVLHPFGRAQYWAGAVPAIDDPSIPRRIAVTSGPHRDLDNWFAYPFMGRTLQNEISYIPISADGRIRPFGSGALNEERARNASFSAWFERLRLQRTTDIISFLPASIELAWMEQHPEYFDRVYGEQGKWGLFRFRDRAPLR